jgi:hypothetical protein
MRARRRRIKGDCCFDHIIGLPTYKGEGRETIIDYDKLLYDSLRISDYYTPTTYNFKN